MFTRFEQPSADFIKQDQDLSQNFDTNYSKNCNIAILYLKFCDKQQGYTLLGVTKYQACSSNIADFLVFWQICLEPWSCLLRSRPAISAMEADSVSAYVNKSTSNQGWRSFLVFFTNCLFKNNIHTSLYKILDNIDWQYCSYTLEMLWQAGLDPATCHTISLKCVVAILRCLEQFEQFRD